jgi:hypothetical protein
LRVGEQELVALVEGELVQDGVDSVLAPERLFFVGVVGVLCFLVFLEGGRVLVERRLVSSQAHAAKKNTRKLLRAALARQGRRQQTTRLHTATTTTIYARRHYAHQRVGPHLGGLVDLIVARAQEAQQRVVVVVAAPPLPLAVEVLPELLDGRFLFFQVCFVCCACVAWWGGRAQGSAGSERGEWQVRQAAAAASTVGARAGRAS